MSKDIYYNAPCGLYHGFLDSEESKQRILDDVLYYAVTREYYRLRNVVKNEEERWLKACDNLGCTVGEKERCLERGVAAQNLHAKEAFFAISRDAFWDHYNNYKTEEEGVMLLAFLALKSILGNRRWAKTNRQMWLSRMDGLNKPQKTLSKAIQKCNTNYGARKIRALLWKYYRVSFYSDNVRGFCFSTTLSMSDLIRQVKTQRTEIKSLQSTFNQARNAAKEEALNDEEYLVPF